MFYVLQDLTSFCSDPGLANILSVIKKALNMIQLIGPILAIASLTLILIKLMANPENKKLKNAFRNWLICLLMLFFIPLIINVTMSLLGVTFEVSACWNYADSAASNGTNSTYIDPDPSASPSTILIPPSEYDPSNSSSNPNSNSSQVVSQRIFIGDSRTVGMRDSVNSSEDIWSCQSAMGLDWFKSTGVPQVEDKIGNGTAVIILMGVNDLYHATSYVNYINDKAKSWVGKGASVYFVSVNPTEGSYDHLNNDITTFNQKVKSGLSNKITYINTNDYLKSKGFTTTDGLHYDTTTYRKIYNYIKGKL